MPRAEFAVAARQLSRRFGYRWILKHISFEVAPGEALLLVGGNGVGKTTLLRLLSGLLRPTTGTVDRPATVGMVAHDTMLYDALSPRENLAFVARLYGQVDWQRIAVLLDRLGLGQVAEEPSATLSRGMLQRLAIARALLHDPALLLLDEPLSGLDNAATGIVIDVLGELLSQGRAFVTATHQLVELSGLATRVGYLIRGELAALEPRDGRDGAAIVSRYRELVAGD